MESRDILSRLNTSVCLRERLAAILGAVGVAVTDQEIFNIESQRNESLRSHGLLELDSRALEVLLTSIGQAPIFPCYYAAETVCELIELYYALRSSYSPEVGDPELVEKIAASFESSEGVVDLIDLDALIISSCDPWDAFEEAVDRCGLSSQDSLIWEYDEFSTGWDGEEWGADYDK